MLHCPVAISIPGISALVRSRPGDVLPMPITARVVERSSLRHFGSTGSFFSICVKDVADACELRIVFWNGAAARFKEVARDNVYTFSGGTLSKANVCHNHYARSKTHIWNVELHFNDHNLDSTKIDCTPQSSLPTVIPCESTRFLGGECKRQRAFRSDAESMPASRFTFVDLCCGIGGFHVAAGSCGGRCLLAMDSDAEAIYVYRLNFDHAMNQEAIIEGRIEDHSAWNLSDEVDLLFAGFPCQPFSGAGWQAGFLDLRGTIIFSIVKVMEDLKPKVALLENVGNFLEHNSGKTMQMVVGMLDVIGYHVQWRKCDAANVLPQTRQRMYITAIRKDVYETACKAGCAGPSPQLPRLSPAPTLSSRHVIQRTLDPKLQHQLFLSPEIGVQYSPVQYDKKSWPWPRYRRILSPDDITPTLMRSYGIAHRIPAEKRRYPQLHGFFWSEGCRCEIHSCDCDANDGGNLRWLSPRECARLQGFPESFQLHTKCEEAWQQLGNAVAPPVVAMFVEELVSRYIEGREDAADFAAKRMHDMLAKSVPASLV